MTNTASTNHIGSWNLCLWAAQPHGQTESLPCGLHFIVLWCLKRNPLLVSFQGRKPSGRLKKISITYWSVRAGAWRGSPWQGQWSCHSSELASCRHHLQGPSSLYRLQLPSDLPPVPPAAESCGELWRLYKHRHTKQMTIRRLLCHDTTQDNPLISFRKEKNKLYCLASINLVKFFNTT